jgi:hypothetical protein
MMSHTDTETPTHEGLARPDFMRLFLELEGWAHEIGRNRFKLEISLSKEQEWGKFFFLIKKQSQVTHV